MFRTEMLAVTNHLWQSTLWTGVVWLLSLALRRNRAAVRYWLWLTASAKFLIPFSFFVSLGSRFGWRTVPAGVPLDWSVAADNFSRPFASPALVPFDTGLMAVDAMPGLLFAIWFCGFAASVVLWIGSWRRTR